MKIQNFIGHPLSEEQIDALTEWVKFMGHYTVDIVEMNKTSFISAREMNEWLSGRVSVISQEKISPAFLLEAMEAFEAGTTLIFLDEDRVKVFLFISLDDTWGTYPRKVFE